MDLRVHAVQLPQQYVVELILVDGKKNEEQQLILQSWFAL
jgi:hypothetical protein